MILGLNLKEAGAILEVLALPAASDPEAMIESTAKAIQQKLKIYCCVVHPRSGAAAATANESAAFKGPFVKQPRISTGAGDHFNAGFALGQVLGFTLKKVSARASAPAVTTSAAASVRVRQTSPSSSTNCRRRSEFESDGKAIDDLTLPFCFHEIRSSNFTAGFVLRHFGNGG